MNTKLGKDTGDTFVAAGDVRVPTIVIDDLAEKFGHPRIIKMDIQGFKQMQFWAQPEQFLKGTSILSLNSIQNYQKDHLRT